MNYLELAPVVLFIIILLALGWAMFIPPKEPPPDDKDDPWQEPW